MDPNYDVDDTTYDRVRRSVLSRLGLDLDFGSRDEDESHPLYDDYYRLLDEYLQKETAS